VPSDDFFKGRTIYSSDLSNYKIVRRDWFAYATNHLAEGSVGLQNTYDLACVSPIYTVFSCQSEVEPRFLFRLLKSPWMIMGYQVHEQASVNRRGAIRYADFATIPVALPPPAEQRRMAEILDTLDEAIRSTERLLAKLQGITTGLVQDLLTCGVDETGQVRNRAEAPQQFAESRIGLIPKAWSVECLSDLATQSPGGTTIGPFGSNLLATDYRPSGVPVIFVRDIGENAFQWVSNVYVSPTKARALAAHSAQPGDVICSKMGLPPCVAAVYPEGGGDAVITADVIRLRPDTTKVMPAWLAAAINSQAVRRQVRAITGGVTRPKVTLADFRRLAVAVPPPAEQDAIVAVIRAADSRRQAEHSRLQKLQLLKQGLVNDLLTGRVRVSGDGEVPA
jgi:type I restriction enzyme S subunit